jgi:hypothetical protein
MEKLFNLNYLNENSKGYDLKVQLKNTFKGLSIMCKKPIKKGSVVAYYKIILHDTTYKGYKDDSYLITVYNKSGRENKNLVGDLYSGSLQTPRYNIPFWGYLSNEPSPPKQQENVFLDINLKENYKNRYRVKKGDTMIYKLVASRNIKVGEEICWCYGDMYSRNYNANCY